MKEGCRRIVRSTLLDAETLLHEPENPPARAASPRKSRAYVSCRSGSISDNGQRPRRSAAPASGEQSWQTGSRARGRGRGPPVAGGYCRRAGRVPDAGVPGHVQRAAPSGRDDHGLLESRSGGCGRPPHRPARDGVLGLRRRPAGRSESRRRRATAGRAGNERWSRARPRDRQRTGRDRLPGCGVCHGPAGQRDTGGPGKELAFTRRRGQCSRPAGRGPGWRGRQSARRRTSRQRPEPPAPRCPEPGWPAFRRAASRAAPAARA